MKRKLIKERGRVSFKVQIYMKCWINPRWHRKGDLRALRERLQAARRHHDSWLNPCGLLATAALLLPSPPQMFQQTGSPSLPLSSGGVSGTTVRSFFRLRLLISRILHKVRVELSPAIADRVSVMRSMLIAALSVTLSCFPSLRSLCGTHIARGHPVPMWMAGVHLGAQLCPHYPLCLTLLLLPLSPPGSSF